MTSTKVVFDEDAIMEFASNISLSGVEISCPECGNEFALSEDLSTCPSCGQVFKIGKVLES